MSTIEEKAREIFGRRASFYTSSTAHTDQNVLRSVVALAAPAPNWRALDVATGTGHTAFALAPYVASVIGTDITVEMLGEAERLRLERGIDNVTFLQADVHSLPFADGTFDLVTCRRAAHHFSDIDTAIAEMRRVLRPGGRLVIDDRSGPEEDAADDLMNRLDMLHDHSHVRQYRPSRWRRMLGDGGFTVEAVEPYVQHRPVSSLTDGVDASDRDEIGRLLAAMTPQERDVFDLREIDGALHLNHWYVMLAAVRND